MILANRTLEVDENYRIKLKLDNLIQVDQLNEIRIDFLDYLRKGLKNKNIAIDAIVEEASTEKKMYTSREKLAYLKEKYPMVEELQKRLGLETDF